MFSIYLILTAALGPGVYSASNRNEYKNKKNNVSGSRARPVRRADNITAICERDCLDNVGSLASQNPMSPRPVTGTALLLRIMNCSSSCLSVEKVLGKTLHRLHIICVMSF
jgi:hypothetical protein